MDIKRRELLDRRLQKVVRDFGLKNCAFCGTEIVEGGDDLFIGQMINCKEIHDNFETALNVGRLFQWVRETMRNILNPFQNVSSPLKWTGKEWEVETKFRKRNKTK